MTDKCTILIVGIGTSPVVFTETEWALCHQKKPMVPDEIVVLVTKYAKGWIKDCTWFVTPGPPESHMRKVDQYTKDGKLIAEFRSAAIASRATGCNAGKITAVCRGRRPWTGGFIWKYAD